MQTVAGRGTGGYSGDGGIASLAKLSYPKDVALDPAGNLYIADSGNNVVRKVTPAGIITTVLASGSAATAFSPLALAFDAIGNGYVGDNASYNIMQFNAAGIIRKIAVPDGFTSGGLAVGADGSLYVADSIGCVVRKVDLAGRLSTIAGNGVRASSGDGGTATLAQLNTPTGVAVDRQGNVYIAEATRIRKVDSNGKISTVAGGGSSDGESGLATGANVYPATVAVDAMGNLFFSDAGSVIRKVAADGTIIRIAGTPGLGGFNGDGGPAIVAQLWAGGLALDTIGGLYIADFFNDRIRKISGLQSSVKPFTFSLPSGGGTSTTTTGSLRAVTVGYGVVQPSGGIAPPAGLEIFGYTQNGILVSEAGVPAAPAMLSGRIYAEVNGTVNTGLAIANPDSQPATITFSFTDQTGRNFGSGTAVISANQQIAGFLNQPPYNGGSSLAGTFSFSSTVPIAVTALRGFTNERGEFLLTTLPVVDLLAPLSQAPTTFPDFADGGGWATEFDLVNPTNSALAGTVQFLDQTGQPAGVTIGGQYGDHFTYTIPPQTSQTFVTSGASSSTVVGSVVVSPSSGTPTPSGIAVFSFNTGGITVTQAGVPASPAANAFALYAESSGASGTNGSIETGLALSNATSTATLVFVRAYNLDGTYTGLTGTLQLPANGQTSIFLDQIPGLSALPVPYQGVLTVSSSQAFSVVALRGRYNQRGDFLITTTPPVNSVSAPQQSRNTSRTLRIPGDTRPSSSYLMLCPNFAPEPFSCFLNRGKPSIL